MTSFCTCVHRRHAWEVLMEEFSFNCASEDLYQIQVLRVEFIKADKTSNGKSLRPTHTRIKQANCIVVK